MNNFIKGFGLTVGSSSLFDKRYVLLFLSLLLWIWIGYSIFSHNQKRVIEATIIQSAIPIRAIDDPVRSIKKETIWINKLYFPKGSELYHPSYGYLGYIHDFVIYFNAHFYLNKKKKIHFIVYSDDGFRLFIDGKMVMEYPKDRPFSKSEREVLLNPGRHTIYMKYFQGYGQLGIVAYYRDNAKYHLLGENSDNIIFDEK